MVERKEQFKAIKIRESLYKKVKALAKKEGRQIGYVFERALNNYFKIRRI